MHLSKHIVSLLSFLERNVAQIPLPAHYVLFIFETEMPHDLCFKQNI